MRVRSPNISRKGEIRNHAPQIMKKDMSRFLDQIHFSFDVKKLDHEELEGLCKEIREEILSTVSKNYIIRNIHNNFCSSIFRFK